jgi:ATP-dependent Clp protease ATP-binding subunit ClpB
MNMERYTQRAQGMIQSAQMLALREGHQRLTPEHIAKVLLEDDQGLCAQLIDKISGDGIKKSQALKALVEEILAKQAKVSGSGAGQVYLVPEVAQVFETAEKGSG